MVGWVRAEVSGERGSEMRLRFAEMLEPDGSLHLANLRSARQLDTYVLSGDGREVFEPRFTFHGFRYVEVTGVSAPPALTGRVVHSDTPRSGWFECSDDLVNRLWRNLNWGQRGNFISVPTDCPQRDERLGWLADAQGADRAGPGRAGWARARYRSVRGEITSGWRRDGDAFELEVTIPPNARGTVVLPFGDRQAIPISAGTHIFRVVSNADDRHARLDPS